ncbi:MAG: iron hydrogenase [Firmicutes bacterium]|nr:iron hydrogenase [Bacillota bacterium]
MNTFEDLYKRIVTSSSTKNTDDVLNNLNYDPYHLECVLNPKLKPEQWKTYHSKCNIHGNDFSSCLFNHIKRDETGHYIPFFTEGICSQCLDAGYIKKMISSPDVMKVMNAIHDAKHPVYALIAPAFLSQFDVITDGQLRSAFKQIGFNGVVEVSLFADILTLKEALEFDIKIVDESDYILTSCCCPMWIQMIRHLKPGLMSHVPKSVSPMIATGRVIKKIVPDAITVFIGPCLAKKAEAREEDINDAIDVVLTFQETKDIFETARIDPADLVTDVREHSSSAGRIYAVSSGVSQAVETTLERIRPEKEIKVKSVNASGVPECKDLLKNLENGLLKANFIEGMGCRGGCVGGPKSLIDKDIAKVKVQDYAQKSLYKTPIDNPYVIEMLHRLNITSIEQLLDDQEIFTRHF